MDEFGRISFELRQFETNSLDGKVRRAKISYRTVEDGSRRMIERPVQRLILLAAVEETSAEGECSGLQ